MGSNSKNPETIPDQGQGSSQEIEKGKEIHEELEREQKMNVNKEKRMNVTRSLTRVETGNELLTWQGEPKPEAGECRAEGGGGIGRGGGGEEATKGAGETGVTRMPAFLS